MLGLTSLDRLQPETTSSSTTQQYAGKQAKHFDIPANVSEGLQAMESTDDVEQRITGKQISVT